MDFGDGGDSTGGVLEQKMATILKVMFKARRQSHMAGATTFL